MKALPAPADWAPHAHRADEQLAQPKAAPIDYDVNSSLDHCRYTYGLPKAARMLPSSEELRQVTYLNTLIEQDQHLSKRWMKPGMGFLSFVTACRTIHGDEIRDIIPKGQRRRRYYEAVTAVARLFGVVDSAKQEGSITLIGSLSVFATQPSIFASRTD